VSDSYPNPVWGHIGEFCTADGWSEVRSDTGHIFWERTLPDGTVLQTHRSMDAGKRISPNVFARILRDQLRVNKAQFWEAIRTGQPVDRRMPLDEAPPEYPAWVVVGLLKYGYTEDQVRGMTPEEAEALLTEKWSTPQT
jgi:hypothetical protein